MDRSCWSPLSGFMPLSRHHRCEAAQANRPGMSNYSAVDRQPFQNLLESALNIQQSQMDSQSLSAILEFERLRSSRLL